MKPVFMHQFNGAESVFSNFEVSEEDQKGVQILLAYYNYEDYNGSAFVLFRKGKKLYEVNGSHCSCNGLEQQWIPEETTVKALTERLKLGLGRSYYATENREEWPNEFADELRVVLKGLSKSRSKKAKAKK